MIVPPHTWQNSVPHSLKMDTCEQFYKFNEAAGIYNLVCCLLFILILVVMNLLNRRLKTYDVFWFVVNKVENIVKVEKVEGTKKKLPKDFSRS